MAGVMARKAWGRGVWVRGVVFSGICVGMLWSGNVAWAMHEVDHRFTIHGQVLDDQGQPVPDVRVTMSAKRLDVGSTAFTDRQGRYEATLHLHNTDLGEPITVTARGESKDITAEFNSQDVTTERRMEVNFGTAVKPQAQALEAEDDRRLWYGAAVLLAVGVVGVVLYRRRRDAGGRGKKSKKKR